MIDTAPYAFTGQSDDIVEVEVDGVMFEHDAWDGCRLRLTAPDRREGELLVDCRMLDTGTWALSATMLSEAHELPDWDVVLDRGHDYSPTLVVHAPAGTRVSRDA